MSKGIISGLICISRYADLYFKTSKIFVKLGKRGDDFKHTSAGDVITSSGTR